MRRAILGHLSAFDLQIFGTTPASKAAHLENVTVTELSVILEKGLGGATWAPRNSHARVHGVKGAPVSGSPAIVPKEGEKTTLDRLVERVGADKAAAFKGLWVSSDVEDNVDGDGDGADDYESILGIMFGNLGTPSPYGWDYYYSTGGLVGDLQRAMQMQDIDVRTAAIAAGIDTFLDKLDDVRSGGDGMIKKAAATIVAGALAAKKAGKRHSAADQGHMDAIASATNTIQEHVKALNDAPSADDEDDDDQEGDDEATKAKKAASRAAKAAAKEAAAKAASAVASVVTPPAAAGEVSPGITAESIAKAISAAMTGVMEEVQTAIAKSSADNLAAIAEHKATVDTLVETQKAAAAKSESALEASTKAAVAAARAPSATGAGPVMGDDGRSKGAATVVDEDRNRPAAIDPAKTTVADVVRLSREHANN